MFISRYLNKFDLPILSSLILLPLISFFCIPIYLYNYGIVWQELIMLIFGWFVAGTGITIGYHRLFSHRSFKTYYLVEWLFMIAGSMALQNTILNWCSDHRLHHKKLDTEDDPYSIMSYVPTPSKERVNTMDLDQQIMTQDKYRFFDN